MVQLMIQKFLDNQKYFKTGLCEWTLILAELDILTEEEYGLANKIIREKSVFSLHQLIAHDGYYWKPGNIKPRLKFIKKYFHLN